MVLQDNINMLYSKGNKQLEYLQRYAREKGINNLNKVFENNNLNKGFNFRNVRVPVANPQSAINEWNTIKALANNPQVKEAVKTGVKQIAKQNVKQAANVAKLGGEMFIPYVGAGIDIGSGYNKIKNGHPYLGGAQILGGLAEAGLDTAGLVAGLITGGAGAVGERAAVGAGSKLAKQMTRYAIQKYGKNVGKFVMKNADTLANVMKARNVVGSTKVQAPKTIADLLYSMGMNGGESNQDIKQEDLPIQEEVLNDNSQGYGYNDYGYYPGQVGIGDTQGNYQQTQQQYQQPNQQQVNQQVQQQYSNPTNMYEILNNWKEQQEYMRPYRDGLNRYVNEFDDRYDQSYARDRWTAAMADLGVPSMKNLIGKYTPLEQGAKKLDLQKLQGQELQGVDQSYNELVAGMKLAEQAGLDPSMVLANPTVMKEILGQMQAYRNQDTKMAIAEEVNRVKMQMNYLDNQIEIAKHNGKQAQAYALAQQRMKLQSQLKTMELLFDNDNPEAVADYANSNLGLKVSVPKNIGMTGADAEASKYKGL